MGNPATATTFVIGEETRPVIEALKERFVARETAPVRRTITYFDTFDWRLYADGGTLSRISTPRGPTLRWESFDGSLRHRLATGVEPAFVEDLPAGRLRAALAPLVQMRRLLPVTEVELTAHSLRILDRNAKTVVRLRLEEPAPARLRVLPVRGYDGPYQRVIAFLRDELGLEPAPADPAAILAAGGRMPGAYSSRVRIELDPRTAAGDAAIAVHRHLLDVLRTNEDGVRRDLDSEFLHDFRVAVRRTRSALTQIRGVLPAAAVGYFKKEFAWLGSLTGPTRDLDVYLLKFGDYQQALPPAARDDLVPLRRFLEARQRHEQALMVAGLDSRRYRRLLADWEAFLSGAPHGPWTTDAGTPPAADRRNADRPILDVAGERVWKVFRRVVRRGGAIDDGSPDDALHELRIDCKKLRYLMEFFRSLYPPAEIGRLIKALKQLQDNLGDFNDYVVQRERLRRFARQMLDEGSATAATLMAIGRLVARLEQGRERERRRFHERFERFATADNRERAGALFVSPRRPADPGDRGSR